MFLQFETFATAATTTATGDKIGSVHKSARLLRLEKVLLSRLFNFRDGPKEYFFFSFSHKKKFFYFNKICVKSN